MMVASEIRENGRLFETREDGTERWYVAAKFKTATVHVVTTWIMADGSVADRIYPPCPQGSKASVATVTGGFETVTCKTCKKNI